MGQLGPAGQSQDPDWDLWASPDTGRDSQQSERGAVPGWESGLPNFAGSTKVAKVLEEIPAVWKPSKESLTHGAHLPHWTSKAPSSCLHILIP